MRPSSSSLNCDFAITNRCNLRYSGNYKEVRVLKRYKITNRNWFNQKSVVNILKMSSTHFVTNIRLQHCCSSNLSREPISIFYSCFRIFLFNSVNSGQNRQNKVWSQSVRQSVILWYKKTSQIFIHFIDVPKTHYRKLRFTVSYRLSSFSLNNWKGPIIGKTHIEFGKNFKFGSPESGHLLKRNISVHHIFGRIFLLVILKKE